jgi:hypothetical protein
MSSVATSSTEAPVKSPLTTAVAANDRERDDGGGG